MPEIERAALVEEILEQITALREPATVHRIDSHYIDWATCALEYLRLQFGYSWSCATERDYRFNTMVVARIREAVPNDQAFLANIVRRLLVRLLDCAFAQTPEILEQEVLIPALRASA